MTRKTHCCQEGHETRGSILGESGGGTVPCPPLISQCRVKARWHPMVLLKDRWGDEFLTHFGMCTQNRPSCQSLTAFILSVRIWLDRLAEMQMIISCAFFFFFFWFHESQRLAGESYLSIHDCKTGLPGPFLGRIDGLVIDRFLWKTTCKQIGKVKVSVFAILEVWWKWESFTCLIGLPSNTNVASHIALNQFILIFEFWINSMNLQIDSSETFWDL